METLRDMLSHDWGATPFGERVDWPDSLAGAVDICAESTFPTMVFSGTDFLSICNDRCQFAFGDNLAYVPGKPGAAAFTGFWPVIGPALESVFGIGAPFRGDDLLLPVHRHGFIEEAYFTFSAIPLRVAGGAVAGVLASFAETTDHFLRERRMQTIASLVGNLAEARDYASALSPVNAALSCNPQDLPFSTLYLIDRGNHTARLMMYTGPDIGPGVLAHQVPLHQCGAHAVHHPVALAAQGSEAAIFTASAVLAGDLRYGASPEPATLVIALPFSLPRQAAIEGVFIAGVNPRRPLDASYRAFFDLIVAHLAVRLASVAKGT
jgi:hypothetical protein